MFWVMPDEFVEVEPSLVVWLVVVRSVLLALLSFGLIFLMALVAERWRIVALLARLVDSDIVVLD